MPIRPGRGQVFCSVRYPDPTKPWSNGVAGELTGSGTLIEEKKIITNAHVALYSREIHVQFRADGEKFEAQVEAVAPEVDLAVLRLKDDKVWKARAGLPRTKSLPKTQENVAVYGYPIGGTDLSVTKGVVSRIGFAGLSMFIQVSAAVNPGNSGGPAIVNGKMIGIVSSRLEGGENIGYVIPNEELDLFLQNIKDGRYDGKPTETAGTEFQRLENQALRDFLKLDAATKGVLLIPPQRPPAGYAFQEFDVVTKIGEHDIDNDGMIRLPDDVRLTFTALIPKLARDNKVPITVMRNGKPRVMSLSVTTEDNRLITEYKGEKPTYFIHGPLVFSPAKGDAISAYSRLRRLSLFEAQSPLITRRFDNVGFSGEELVVITSPMFQHKISKGYADPVGQVIRNVNGITIKNLPHLIEVIRDSKDEYLRFRCAELGSGVMVFRREEMDRATVEIMEDNGIIATRRGSPNMLKVWNKK